MKNIHEERTKKDKPFSYKKMLARYKIAKKYTKGKVLDIGCGYGYQSEMFDNYYGIDYYKPAIEDAQRNYPNKTFEFMKIPPLKFPANCFDTVICCEMIEHIKEDDGKKLIKEIYRVLKDGGILFLTTPNADNKKPEVNHDKGYTCKEIKELTESNGFSVIYVGGLSISFNKHCPNWLKKVPRLRGFIGKIIDITVRSFLIKYGEKNPSKAEHQVIVCKK